MRKLGQVSRHMSQHACQACAVLRIYKDLIAIPSLPFSKCAHTMWCHTDITRLNRKVSRVYPHKKVIHMCIYASMKSSINSIVLMSLQSLIFGEVTDNLHKIPAAEGRLGIIQGELLLAASQAQGDLLQHLLNISL